MTSKLKDHSILIVDDEESIRDFLEIMLRREGAKVATAPSAKVALELIKKGEFELVITDISMPEMTGIELLTQIKQRHPHIAVIVMTAFGSAESAVSVMKLGAVDYITKPFEIEEMKLSLQSAFHNIALETENRNLRSELKKTFSTNNMIGNSPAMKLVFDLIDKVSETKANIMILGESGTGKELVAHAIHRNHAEPQSPFIVINCAAVPEQLFESELFGHKRGSFTGAVADKKGLLELANTGTLFLDEVGDIPLSAQVKLLRVIQQRNFRAVGGAEDIQIDLRIICATNKNLEEEVAQGKFREDLFYRLNVIQIKMPALRERKEDIPLLANHFLNKFKLSMGKAVQTISNEAMEYLESYDFPGNVRELENIMERAVALESKSAIFPESLPPKIIQDKFTHSIVTAEKPSNTVTSGIEEKFNLEKGVEAYERDYILRALDQCGGVKKRTAELLGISFRSLRYRIDKYGIADPNPEESD